MHTTILTLALATLICARTLAQTVTPPSAAPTVQTLNDIITPPPTGQWVECQSPLLTLTGGTYNLVFEGLATGDKSVLIDDVRLDGKLLVDGGFEVPNLATRPAPRAYVYNPPGTKWTFSGSQASASGSGVQRNGSDWGRQIAPEGQQTAFLQGKGTLRRTITAASGKHTLFFQMAQRAIDQSNQSVRVTFYNATSTPPPASTITPSTTPAPTAPPAPTAAAAPTATPAPTHVRAESPAAAARGTPAVVAAPFLSLTWDASPGAKNYHVYRKVEDGWTRVATTEQTTHTFNVPEGEQVYVVTSVTDKGESQHSDEIMATVTRSATAAPGRPRFIIKVNFPQE
jgi:hypothetical protein